MIIGFDKDKWPDKNLEGVEIVEVPGNGKCMRYGRDIAYDAFNGFPDLKEIHLPSIYRIPSFAFNGCINLNKIYFETAPTAIEENAFFGCHSLEEIHLPAEAPIYSLSSSAFTGCPENLKFILQDITIPYKNLEFTRKLSDGLSIERDFAVLRKAYDILGDDTFSPILVSKLCAAEHFGRLDIAAEQYKQQFQTVGFYDISDDVDVEAKEKLTELFKANSASRGVVPRIIDALTIVSTALNIPPEQIVKSFEDKKFRDAIIAMRTCHDGNHFFDCEAALFAMNFDINTIKQTILSNPYKDFASVLLCKSYMVKNKDVLNAAKWIVQHPEASYDNVSEIFSNAEFLKITPDMTVDQIKSKISLEKAKMEIVKIEREYKNRDFHFSDCVCNLPKTEVNLGRYKAYIMDGQDPRQVRIGYDTNCCQHLNGAGESAMMYGLVNPDAGFWVIEDKLSGKIMAQAEIWQCKESSITQPGKEVSFKSRNLIKLLETFVETEYADDVANEIGYDIWTNEKGDICYGADEDSPIYTEGATISIKNPEILLYDIGENIEYREKFNYFAKNSAKDGKYMQLDANGNVTEMESRKSINDMLVFDNIEFSDDRDIAQFAPIIAKWCDATPYNTVLMGDGYNALKSNKIHHVSGMEPPVTAKILEAIDDPDNHEYDFKSDGLARIGIPDKDALYAAIAKNDRSVFDVLELEREDYMPYTDANKSCSILKDHGLVEPYFRMALDEYIKSHQEENTPEKKTHKSRTR